MQDATTHSPRSGSSPNRAWLGSAVETADGYARCRSDRRQLSRELIHVRVLHPIETPRLVRDPLLRPGSAIRTGLSSARLVVTGVLIHGLIVSVFAIVNHLAGDRSEFRPPERVQVRIIDKLEPPPVVEVEPERGPVAPDFAPKEPEAPKSKPRVVPKKLIAVVEETPEPAEPEAAPVRHRVVGLSFESTVSGGQGPSFGTGTTRMGRTENQAVAPTRAALAPTSGGGQLKSSGGKREQRVASRIPTRDAVFTDPKRARPSKPSYPAKLKAQGIEGSVLVRVHIDAAGNVSRVSVLKSSGHAAFDDAARRAARAEKFVPAKRDGHAVPFTLSYSYRFRIEDN